MIVMLVLLVVGASWWWIAPFPGPGADPVVDLLAARSPWLHEAIRAWHYLAPGVALVGGWLVARAVGRVWFASRGLPAWQIAASDATPAIVVGEVHHPVALREVPAPRWLTIPERGLYTGILVVGAIGSGKTSACMRPFARQLLAWQADDSRRRMAGLVLEVKGDFCHQVRDILIAAGRGEDYIELGLGGRWQWNPLSAHWLDSYSLAYTVASLINQLFGKGSEPFWQQAYTNLVRWLIELHRMRPGGWVTLRDVYRCALEPERIATLIAEVAAEVDPPQTVRIENAVAVEYAEALTKDWVWSEEVPGFAETRDSAEVRHTLEALGITFTVEGGPTAGGDPAQRERLEAVRRWFTHDWGKLDKKIGSTVSEGLSVFLSVFDLPEVASVFCPPAPPPRATRAKATAGDEAELPAVGDEADLPEAGAGVTRPLPPLDEVIESGKVLALNMPAGTNAALGARGRRDAQTSLAPDVAAPAGADATGAESGLSTGHVPVRRVSEFRHRRRRGSEWRREGVCAHAAVPADSDCGDAIHLVTPGRARARGSVAGAPPDAPDADLPVAVR